jgi:MoxR-like ATPase
MLLVAPSSRQRKTATVATPIELRSVVEVIASDSEVVLGQCWRDLAEITASGIDRVILYGPPGTGKTYAALRFGITTDVVERLICTEDVTSAEVTGSWCPAGADAWEWLEGPAIRAWRGDGIRGGRLVVDEVDRASGDVLSLLLAMTDTDDSARWKNPQSREVVRPAPGYSVVMTTNLEELEELPPALRDRFPVAIRIDQPHPSAVRSLSPDLRRAALNGSLGEPSRRISLRTFYAFDRLRRSTNAQRAASLLFDSAEATAFLDALSIGALG